MVVVVLVVGETPTYLATTSQVCQSSSIHQQYNKFATLFPSSCFSPPPPPGPFSIYSCCYLASRLIQSLGETFECPCSPLRAHLLDGLEGLGLALSAYFS